MTATVAGIHLGLDTHANRPAANTVPDGSLYSCSTHNLLYKSNYAGNSWATWGNIAAGAAGTVYVSNGTVPSWGYTPLHGARAYNNANLSRNSGDFGTMLTFNTNRYDSDSIHSTSSNTDRLTIPTGMGGLWRVGASVEFASNATGIRYLYILCNGVAIVSDVRGAVNGDVTRLSCSTEWEPTAGQYFQALAVQTSGGALNILSSTSYSPEFWASLAGA
ncbi:MAG TPA: hypothetical protein VE011_09735 [Candidatus Dormibacteraeota bacterium]|nr:hypothetical protein [Candidatus Dormibacteraeota bacterium]